MGSWYVHPIPLSCKRDRHAVCAVDNFRVVITGGTDGSEPLSTMELVDIRQTRNNQDLVSSMEFLDAGSGGGCTSAASIRSSNSSMSSSSSRNNINNNFSHPSRTHPVLLTRASTTNATRGRTLLPNLPGSKTLTGHESVIHGEFLYIIGGYHDDNDFIPLKSVYRINIGTIINEENDVHTSRLVWESVSQMNKARQDFSSARHGDYIYVFGGYDNHTNTYLSCAERYNTINDEWENIPPMTTEPRASHVSITVRDKIYILGGRFGLIALRTTELFDTKKQSWEEGAPMLLPLHSMAAVSIDDWIVTVGGRSDDPSKVVGQSFVWNTAEGDRECKDGEDVDGNCSHCGTWHQTREHLTIPRKDHAAVILDHTEIVALGGSSGNGGFTYDSIESISFHDIRLNDDIEGNKTNNFPAVYSECHIDHSVSSGYNDTWYNTMLAQTATPETPPPVISVSAQTQPTSISLRPSTRSSTAEPAMTLPSGVKQPPAQYQFHVFLSYNWGLDDSGRDNRERVTRLKEELKSRGVKMWFDGDQLSVNIVDEMTAGIDNSMAIIVFLTKRYVAKVAGKGPNGHRDNCRLEFNYARNRKKPREMIPVVMEETCCDPTQWEGVVNVALGNHLQIRYTKDSQLESCANSLLKRIKLITKNSTNS